MAITGVGQVLKFAALNDAKTGLIKVQSLVLSHSAAATATVTDTAGNPIASLAVTTSNLVCQIIFPKGILVNGLKVSALSAGAVTAYTL